MSAYLKTITESLYGKPCFNTNEEAYEQGQAAGDQAYPLTHNPYKPFTALHEFWAGGWHNSTDELCGT